MFAYAYAASTIYSPICAALNNGQHPTKLNSTGFFRDKSRNYRYRNGKFKPAHFVG